MASTIRITPGGSSGGGGGRPPSDSEPPGGAGPDTDGAAAARPEDGADGETGSAAPSTQRTPLASGAAAAPGAPVITPPDRAERSSGGGEAPAERPPEDASATIRLEASRDHAAAELSPGPAAADDAVTVALTPFTGRPQCPECGERFSRGSRFCAFDGHRLADAAEEVSSDPLVGQTLGGKYTVVRSIGEGGMGTVYEVRHNALDRKFALKILRPEIAQNGEHIQRFLQEAKAAAAIGHPNIVSVSDFGEHEVHGRSVPFIVMELLRGVSLASVLKEEKTLSPRRAAAIIAGCAEALAAAHEAGVIHRDLKPDNIFLTGDDSGAVKVLDFGVAKMQGTSKRLTKMGMVFGTPHYMSPEQARGQVIDHRADIYALGVILYECLAGHVPFEADTSMGVLTKQIFANPEPIERVAPNPRGLGALGSIVMRCLAKEPDERFGSMSELAEAIRMIGRDPKAAAAEALSASGRHKRPALRLREETAIPRPEPAAEEPAPRSWVRALLLAAAGGAVFALVIVVAQGVFKSGPDAGATPQGSAPPIAASAAPPATGAEPSSTTAAPVPTRPDPLAARPDVPAATSPPDATSVAAGAPSAPSSPGATSRPTATPSASAKPTSPTGVIDPWSRPTKKPPGTTSAVVDPWAKRT